ncbi:MAG TPA: MmgE/PrpD family protein, partial [Usitatibacter sp.]|nr:MmgE/PrpD family protein [Usitatibacter sp.]
MTETTAITDYVAGFINAPKASDIPKEVAHLGKRSVLDGIGLALAGSASEGGHIAQEYLARLDIARDSGCTVIGSSMRLPARFA